MVSGASEGGNVPQHYVVEILTEDGPRYALCQALTVVEAGSASLPASIMEDFLGEHTLRAVAVPDAGGFGEHPEGAHWTQLAAGMQSGHDHD